VSGCSLQHNLRIGLFRFTLAPARPLVVPALNKGNMLRGGFGHAFRRLCCIPQCRDAKSCPLANSCPYKAVFEPSPPPGADRLSKNQDIPRPFVFRAPQTRQTRFEPGQPFEFGLVLVGRALDFLPYFVLSFRDLAEKGLGPNRARCVLERVEAVAPAGDGVIRALRCHSERSEESPDLPLRVNFAKNPGISGNRRYRDSSSPSAPQNDNRHRGGFTPLLPPANGPQPALVYSADDQLFRSPERYSAQPWIDARLYGEAR